MSESMTYVYGVVRGLDEVPAVSGVGGSPVRVIESAGLQALVSTVDAAEFGEEGLRKNFEDVRWLEATARDHNQVVDEVGEVVSVAPLSMATVYFTDDRVRAVLAERAAVFTELLDEITGRQEWGVKAYVELAELSEAVAGAETAGGSTGPGTAYLNRLRNRQQHEDQAREAAFRWAEEVHEALRELSRSARVHPPQNRELAGYTGTMVLNGAYLVDVGRAAEFAAAVEEWGQVATGRLELTGPWPPYSFAVVEEERG